MRVTHSEGPSTLSPPARHPARDADWTMVPSSRGSLPWQAGARSVEILSLDGKSISIRSPSLQPGSPLSLPTQGQGVFGVRFR